MFQKINFSSGGTGILSAAAYNSGNGGTFVPASPAVPPVSPAAGPVLLIPAWCSLAGKKESVYSTHHGNSCGVCPETGTASSLWEVSVRPPLSPCSAGGRGAGGAGPAEPPAGAQEMFPIRQKGAAFCCFSGSVAVLIINIQPFHALPHSFHHAALHLIAILL